MACTFLDDHGDLPAEFPVTFLGNTRLAVEPGIEGATHVQERHAGLGQRGQIVQRLRFRHVAAEDGSFRLFGALAFRRSFGERSQHFTRRIRANVFQCLDGAMIA